MLADFQRQFTDDLINNNVVGSSRFNIYRNNVQQSLRRLLANIYRKCHIILGNDNFMYLAQKFVTNYLPTQASLYQYGGKFVSFLDQEQQLQQDYPWVSDLAKIEWAYHRAFFVGDLPNQQNYDIDQEELLRKTCLLHDSLWLNAHISEIAIDAMTLMRYDNNIDIDDMRLCDENRQYCDYAHQDVEQKYHILVARGSASGIFQRPLTHSSYVFLDSMRKEKSLLNAIKSSEKHDKDWQYHGIINLLISERLIYFGEENE